MRITNQHHLQTATALLSAFSITGLPISTKKKLEDIVNQLLDDATKTECQLLVLKPGDEVIDG